MINSHEEDLQTTYWRPWQEVDLEVWIDPFDIVDHTEDSSRGLVDVKAAQRRVAADIVEAVDCCAWRNQATVGRAVICAWRT